jgi:hypothetical protein
LRRVFACSAFDELVVADTGSRHVVFSDVGDLVVTFGHGRFTGVAVHGSTATAFAQLYIRQQCVVWS